MDIGLSWTKLFNQGYSPFLFSITQTRLIPGSSTYLADFLEIYQFAN